jgi:F-type H+-transporting ATPase subunit epsilon
VAKNTFRCKLVTPSAALLDDDVTYASVPAWDGLFGVLPGRAPILSKLGLGELRVDFPDAKGQGGSRSYFVEGGFARMEGDRLTILAERAMPAEEINAAEAEAELKTALSMGAGAEAARIQKQAAVDRAQAKVAMAKARRGGI